MSMNNDCATCGVDTWETHEYYMVHKEIWDRYGAGKGMLCIGCLEDNMGRQLVGSDFTSALINRAPDDAFYSARLLDRLGSRVAA